LSQDGNAVTIIGGAAGNGIAVVITSNTSGITGTINTGTLTLAGGNNITLSQNGNAITISAGNAGGGVVNVIAGNTTGTTASISTGTMTLAGGNNITLSQAGNAITISQRNPYLSTYEPYPFVNTGTGAISMQSNTSGGMSLFRFFVREPSLAELVNVVASANFTTGSTSSFQQSGTLAWGIYSQPTGTNSTQLHLMGSSQFSYLVTYNNSSITLIHPTTTNALGGYGYGTTNSSGLNISSRYTGLKLFALGLNSTLTEGDYWLGIHHRNSSSSFNSGLRFSLYGNTYTLTGLAPLGSFSSAYTTGTGIPSGVGGNWNVGVGSYTTAGMTALVNSVTMSQISGNIGLTPYMKFYTRL
jgi:hypothetical protein